MVATTRQYGRLCLPDERDRQFRLRAARSERNSRYWASGSWLDDQQLISRCVGSGWAGWLYSAPHQQFLNPQGIYEIARHFDTFPGDDYEGTTVRAGAKVLEKLGFIGRYEWASGIDAMIRTVLEIGPVVVGTDWYADMDEPDARGYLIPTGELVGGHAYLVNGVNVAEEKFRMRQSWGRKWGQRGTAWIKFDVMAELLAADGECCCGREVKLRAA